MHFLVIPKSRDGLTQLSKAVDSNKALLGHLMFVAQKVAKEQVTRQKYTAAARCLGRTSFLLPGGVGQDGHTVGADSFVLLQLVRVMVARAIPVEGVKYKRSFRVLTQSFQHVIP